MDNRRTARIRLIGGKRRKDGRPDLRSGPFRVRVQRGRNGKGRVLYRTPYPSYDRARVLAQVHRAVDATRYTFAGYTTWFGGAIDRVLSYV
jgi:hypothetical protein